MKSNYQMLNDFIKEFSPKEPGYLFSDEVWKVKKELCLIDMDKLALQNMRDFAVMFIGHLADKEFDENNNYREGMRLMDIMSGITGVIDGLMFAIEVNGEYK